MTGAAARCTVPDPPAYVPSMLSDPWFYLVAIPAVVLMGFAKGGFAGLGTLAVPLLSLRLPPVQAASITLPILLVQDAVGIALFRGTWDRAILKLMLPFAAAGILLGFLLAAYVSDAWVEIAVGAIAIAFGAYRLWVERHGVPHLSTSGPWLGATCGLATGFASQIAHAGAPPFQVYVLTRRLPRDTLIGTSAVFFATVNWLKVPAYAALGQFTRANLLAAAALLPAAIVSTWVGSRLVRRVDGHVFYRVIYALMIAVGAKMLWDGSRHAFA